MLQKTQMRCLERAILGNSKAPKTPSSSSIFKAASVCQALPWPVHIHCGAEYLQQRCEMPVLEPHDPDEEPETQRVRRICLGHKSGGWENEIQIQAF